jgi:RNA polymerase sigma-70 factor (ECF subfamily)
LFAEHHDFVWRSARRLGTPAFAADDVVQDVFLVVARRLSDFEERSSLRTWLFGITMRVVRAHQRKELRHRRRSDAAGAAAEPPSADEAERHQRLDLLDGMLAELDEDKRAVFILVELEGMTAPEIAGALGVPANTVYSRLRLARAQLRRSVRRHLAREQGGRP